MPLRGGRDGHDDDRPQTCSHRRRASHTGRLASLTLPQACHAHARDGVRGRRQGGRNYKTVSGVKYEYSVLAIVTRSHPPLPQNAPARNFRHADIL